jgi:hypothetical protein
MRLYVQCNEPNATQFPNDICIPSFFPSLPHPYILYAIICVSALPLQSWVDVAAVARHPTCQGKKKENQTLQTMRHTTIRRPQGREELTPTQTHSPLRDKKRGGDGEPGGDGELGCSEEHISAHVCAHTTHTQHTHTCHSVSLVKTACMESPCWITRNFLSMGVLKIFGSALRSAAVFRRRAGATHAHTLTHTHTHIQTDRDRDRDRDRQTDRQTETECSECVHFRGCPLLLLYAL